ncbi:phosphoenolpyruvate--protein phosphotransferase [Lacisediminihabitans changchengi]|uniref:Phosphoenolpyruvate-protein phosphotransferase n=1 Tax=Lacisediminihabitans changchengi TaxID=2787634 RepID=A0A934W5S5_9MICO|nr:phosphoenolpyruvate--protein phosphotransferase [Lacisediminihabitans changchengi]MBK4348855.1 phosphoenolpyruvate--protein phosphotransferase [Lacisediminihabitans changchengi]
MELKGVGVGRGLAVGPVLCMPDPLEEPALVRRTTDAAAEASTTRAALSAVAAEFAARGATAGGTARDILEASAMMASDPTVLADVDDRIAHGLTGERAVFEAFRVFESALIDLGGRMAERACDVRDVSRRVIARLRGVAAPGIPQATEPYILCAGDLSPADAAMLDPDLVLALFTRDGGPSSHTAILTRARAIPAVVGIGADVHLANGETVIVDAARATVRISPTELEVSHARRVIADRASAASVPLRAGALADGTAVPLLANVGTHADAEAAVTLGAEGVGLLRTELLFFDWVVAPTVEEQRAQYTEVFRRFPDQPVVVRVFDVGADKPLRFVPTGPPEPNPALGNRGLRALRRNEWLLRDQLEALALAQAETGADLRVMAPMVNDADDAAYFVDLAHEMGVQGVGMTVEVPSLALLADQVLEFSDFASIGTNDLTQYTMAADRMLGTFPQYQDPWHPAVLRLVKMICDAGAAAGKPVGICGEAAADARLAVVLVGLGATTLSMTPVALADVRAELALHTLAEARMLAARALQGRTAADSRARASVALH